MKHKLSFSERLFDIINIIIMCFLMFITLYPLLFVIFASLSDSTLLMMNNTSLLLKPLGFQLSAYQAVLKYPLIRSGYLNTVFIVVAGVGVNLIMTSLGAYFLSRKNVFWKRPAMIVIIITMYFGGGLIPSYLNIKNLGMLDSLWSVILPSAISTFNMMIMRTAFESIPRSLEEVAEIDGAGHFIILFRIVLPLSMSTIAVMVLFYGVHHWNAWFGAMLYITKKELFPLQLVLRDIVMQNQTADISNTASDIDKFAVAETIKYAAIVVATLPILILYPFLQKYFIKGVMIGAVKG